MAIEIGLGLMACSRCSAQLRKVVGQNVLSSIIRPLSTSSSLQGKKPKEPVLRKWGLERFPRAQELNSLDPDPLADLPDYTFLDGRPTPMTKHQLEKREKQYQLTKRIFMLAKEVENAKAGHATRIQEEQIRRQNILESKLKPKSDEL